MKKTTLPTFSYLFPFIMVINNHNHLEMAPKTPIFVENNVIAYDEPKILHDEVWRAGSRMGGSGDPLPTPQIQGVFGSQFLWGATRCVFRNLPGDG